ncbi:hypothetical protein HanIR_Chr07g0338401 [Helianthus annuus]|nr:hypothetical protein HanIR_Chr07g0338401 [Helianthus annuus]
MDFLDGVRGGEQNDDKLEKSGRKMAIFKLLGQTVKMAKSQVAKWKLTPKKKK